MTGYRLLGPSGCVVSSLGLGAMTLGPEIGQEASFEVLDAFVAAGGTLIDTADVYGAAVGRADRGASERVIGAWLAERPAEVRDRVVLATKARFPMDDSPNGGGLSARHLYRAVDASLLRLGVETIDLYQAHAHDPLTPVEETLRTLEALVRAGKIRYYGLSNVLGWQLTEAVWTARSHGLVGPVTVQVQHNLLSRAVEWEVLPAARAAGIGSLPWSPLAGGWLTGKYERGAGPPSGTRFAAQRDRAFQPYDLRDGAERTWRVIDAVREVAVHHDVPPAQIAIAWLLARAETASVLVGARSARQLEELLGAAGVALEADDVALLDLASTPPDPGYPYDAGAAWQRSRRLEGGR